jgi:uncharacterized OB-fold protein
VGGGGASDLTASSTVSSSGAPPLPPSIAPTVLRVDDDGTATLLGGWSPTSGLRHFPRAPVCPYSGADDVEPVDLPRTGRLWLWTEVRAAPGGYAGPVPYGLGIVELDGEPLLRVVGRLAAAPEGGWSQGTPVRLVAEVLVGPDGEAATTWTFERARDPGAERTS